MAIIFHNSRWWKICLWCCYKIVRLFFLQKICRKISTFSITIHRSCPTDTNSTWWRELLNRSSQSRQEKQIYVTKFVSMNINVRHGKFTLNLLNQRKKSQTNNRGNLQPQQNHHQFFLGLSISQILTITFPKEWNTDNYVSSLKKHFLNDDESF